MSGLRVPDPSSTNCSEEKWSVLIPGAQCFRLGSLKKQQWAAEMSRKGQNEVNCAFTGAHVMTIRSSNGDQMGQSLGW